jgi:hypothetical protein
MFLNKKREIFLDKDRMIDNVQKHNNCNTCPDKFLPILLSVLPTTDSFRFLLSRHSWPSNYCISCAVENEFLK